MKFSRYTMLAAAILTLSAGGLLAQDPDTPDDSQYSESAYGLFKPGKFWLERSPYQNWMAARFGWWGVTTSGSKEGIGEWMEPESTPFWDIDTLITDGCTTTNFFATGTENASTEIGLDYYRGPGFSLDFDYNRFIHGLNHDPLGGLPVPPNGMPPAGGFYDPVLSDGDVTPEQPGYPMFGEDLTVNSDYAIRVQELDAGFKGNLTENISWRLNLWGMRKEGTRPANATQHCLSASPPGGGASNTCHVVSQGQRIDWLTMEIEPVIEARFGWLTVEYSRTMRTFQQDDQIVTADFSRGTPYGFGPAGAAGAYAYVPENYTEIDRIKLYADLTENTRAYVLGSIGNTHNSFRESDRRFGGIDGRITNTTVEGLTLTAYGKKYSQDTAADNESLNTRYPGQSSLWLEQYTYDDAPFVIGDPVVPQEFYSENNIYTGIVNRQFTSLGLKGRWRPFMNSCGPAKRLAVTGGYEYSEIERTNAIYDLRALTPPVLFTQPNTFQNMFFVGLEHKWTSTFDTYIRYRMITSEYPLVGEVEREQLSIDAAINSNLPEHQDRVEIGGTWTPSDTLLVNASLWIENSFNHSDWVNFDEDNYPIVVSAWWSPTDRWSLNGGYATFSNWITQDITLGREDGLTTNPNPPPDQIPSASELPAWTTPWGYTGRADVLNVGATYLWTCRLRLNGGFEYVRGYNYFDAPAAPAGGVANADPPPATVDFYTDLPGYSAARVNTYRATAGVDYEWRDNFNVYFRYNLLDYEDIANSYNSGIAHMFLAGVAATF